MEASEIRAMDPEELETRLGELVEAHFNLRFQHRTGQLENPRRLSEIKRDIARLKTIKREKELNLR